jgi:hypothetical protein
MRKLNLHVILHDIIQDLRALQNIYSEPIDIDGVSDSGNGEDGGKVHQAENELWERLQEGKKAYSAGNSDGIPIFHENRADRETNFHLAVFHVVYSAADKRRVSLAYWTPRARILRFAEVIEACPRFF